MQCFCTHYFYFYVLAKLVNLSLIARYRGAVIYSCVSIKYCEY